MFDRIETAPPDPILGLEEAFKRDPNPAKINLAAGVYKDPAGNTPVLRVVKRAEQQILQDESSKSYLGIAGAPENWRMWRGSAIPACGRSSGGARERR